MAAPSTLPTAYARPELYHPIYKLKFTPDFRGRMDIALDILTATPPDVFNHNMETVSRLYREARPGANYAWSLKLLQEYKQRRPEVLTKIRLDGRAG